MGHEDLCSQLERLHFAKTAWHLENNPTLNTHTHTHIHLKSSQSEIATAHLTQSQFQEPTFSPTTARQDGAAIIISMR